MTTQQKNKEELSSCERALRRMVCSISDDVANGKVTFIPLDDEELKENGLTYYEAYSVNYTYSQYGELKGVRVLLAGGGPNIFLDTEVREVQGFWGSDRYSEYCGNNCDYILDYFEELSPMVKKDFRNREQY